MKQYYILLLSFLLLSSTCKKEDTKPIDQLPRATTEGKNTFGCLVNGEAWIAHIEDNPVFFGEDVLDVHYDEEDYLRIVAEREVSRVDQTMILHATVFPQGSSVFRRGSNLRDLTDACNDEYELDTSAFHQLTITKLDLDYNIISGTFGFTLFLEDCDTLEITEGRFDAIYHF